MGRRATHERIPIHVLRLNKLPPAQFRVLLHGMAYETGWSPALCAKECGLSLPTVQRATRALVEAGYAITIPHPFTRQLGYRFRLCPLRPDERKAWYQSMLEANAGNVDGVVMGPAD